MNKRRRVNMSTVDSFLVQRHIAVTISHIKTDFSYFKIVRAEALVETGSPSKRKLLAHVISLARLSGDDLNKEVEYVGLRVALARAKRGLYALLRGKKIHDPLCQGSLEAKQKGE